MGIAEGFQYPLKKLNNECGCCQYFQTLTFTHWHQTLPNFSIVTAGPDFLTPVFSLYLGQSWQILDSMLGKASVGPSGQAGVFKKFPVFIGHLENPPWVR